MKSSIIMDLEELALFYIHWI